jgi:hypothetical protein
MTEKYYCRTCKGYRKHNVLFKKEKIGSNEWLRWSDDYLLVECSGCETISFIHIYGDDEMYDTTDNGLEYYYNTTVFPPILKDGTEIKDIYLLPGTIQTIYKETLSAFKAGCYILTAGGFRAIIEALCNNLRIKDGNLSIRINLLNESGYLTLSECKRLHSIRFLGNDSLHEMAIPKKEQLLLVLEIINHLLENLYIHDKKIENKIDVIIDTYDSFLNLIRNHISKEIIGKEISISELLGKSKRLIDKKDLDNFEKNFISEITKGQHDFISIIDPNEKKPSKYKIEKMPELPLPW